LRGLRRTPDEIPGELFRLALRRFFDAADQVRPAPTAGFDARHGAAFVVRRARTSRSSRSARRDADDRRVSPTRIRFAAVEEVTEFRGQIRGKRRNAGCAVPGVVATAPMTAAFGSVVWSVSSFGRLPGLRRFLEDEVLSEAPKREVM